MNGPAQGRGPRRLVFLSHTSELRDYPESGSFVAAAVQAVVQAGHVPTDMQYFAARNGKPADVVRDKVGEADVFVLIAGFRYGSRVPGWRMRRRSYTELEYDTARKEGLPRLVFLLDDATIGPQAMFGGPDDRNRQSAFRGRLEADRVVGRVRTPENLEYALYRALCELPPPPEPPRPVPVPEQPHGGTGSPDSRVPLWVRCRDLLGRHRRRVAGAGFLALVLAVVLLAVSTLGGGPDGVWREPETCGDTSTVVQLVGADECVGRVTDAATMPAPLRKTLYDIDNENATIEDDPSAVAVAYMLPIPAASDSPDVASAVTTARYAQELAGALRAQQRANHTTTLGQGPKVRLVVYNIGREGASWVRVLNDLEQQIADGRVVAVAGVGPGVGGGGALSEALSRLSVPVFRSGAIADRLTVLRSDPPGLFRTTSTSSRLAAAADAVLGDARTVQVVQDMRADNADGASLAQDFAALRRTRDGGVPGPAPIVYNSAGGPAGTTFDNALDAGCPRSGGGPPGPDAFFLPGRGPQLAEFLDSLNRSSCPGPITVLAGPDGAGLLEQLRQARAAARDVTRDPQAQQLVAAFDSGRVRVRFLGLAHPDQWTTPAFARSYTDTIASFADLRGTDVLQEGDQLVGYDAALTAITCVRAATDRYGPIPAPRDVLDACTTAVTAARPVYGAGGPIAFGTPGQTTTAPVPVVEIRADGSAPMVTAIP